MSEDVSFPIKPIGEYIVCMRYKDKAVNDVIILPKGVRQTDMIVAKVLEIGTGTVSITGHRCEMDVAVGDIIVFPAAAGAGIDHGVRRVLERYGINRDDMDDMIVVVQGSVLGKFKTLPPTQEKAEKDANNND